MADPLTEALMRNQMMHDPQRQQATVDALARRQATGGVISDLSGGRYGQGMQKGPTPEAMQATMENQARQAGYQSYMMGRQERADKESARRFDITTGVDMAKLAATQGVKQNNLLEKDVDAISKGMEDLQPAMTAYRSAAGMMEKYGDDNVPGIGFLEGGPGMLGSMARFVQGPEAQENFGQMQMLFNKLMRGEIGSQQTIQEAQRVRQAYGATGMESEEVFRTMFPLIGQALEEEKAQILSRGTPAAQELWSSRSGAAAKPPTGQGEGVQTINFEDL